MKFEDTELLRDALVEKAFNYAQDYMLARTAETYQGTVDMINEEYDYEQGDLDAALEYQEISQDVYDEETAQIEAARSEAIQNINPDDIDRELTAAFLATTLSEALEVQNYSEGATPEAIAAALLSHVARDPVDCRNIEKEFGPAIADVVAERLHVDAYPVERDDLVKAASPLLKRLLMAEITNSFRLTVDTISRLEPRQQAYIEDAEVEGTFFMARPLWGNDKKLDERLAAVFNHAAELASSDYSLEVTTENKPELVKGAHRESGQPLPAQKEKKPVAIYGDDGF